MRATQTNLQQILEGTKQYVIPLFQRTYSWKRKNWKTLWDDLLVLYDSQDKREHFLGAVVSMPVEMSPSGVSKFLLIDGQQRITTIFLILAAIRDLAIKLDSNLSDQIRELYLINKWAEGTNKLRLLPSQTDREQFSEIIHGKKQLDANSRIVEAFEYFKNVLAKKDLNGEKIDLERLHSVLIEQISIVSIVLDKEENPYLIFESLNAKGEPLTQADLVRNYILMQFNNPESQEVAYKDIWLPMQKALDAELTNFIWRYLNKDGTFATFVKLNSIYDEIRKRYGKKGQEKIEDLLVEMHTFSGYYLRMIEPEKEEDRNIRERFERIKRWEIKTAYPFLLNLYNDYCKQRITAGEFCQILDMVESFVIRRFFCRVPSNALNKIFIGLYQTLDKENIVASIRVEFLKRDWPTDKRFLDAWVVFPIYTSGTAKCRHILESLENALVKNNEPVDLRHSKISIEHIMPQVLNEQWEETLGKETSIVHETYLHTMGNLTLTGNNSPMGNKEFNQKREVFAKSNFALNEELAESIVWGRYIIEKRAKSLGQTALQIWEHPGGDDQIERVEVHADDPTGSKPTGFYLLGEEYTVSTWRDMLLQVLAILAETDEEKFIQNATKVKTSRRVHISTQSSGMITPMRIQGTDLWVEANQSSRSVLWVISQTLDACDYSMDSFEAYW